MRLNLEVWTMARMTAVAVCLCVLSGLVASDALAHEGHDDDESPDGSTWTLQVDPLTTALGYVHLQVEHAFSDHVSLYAGPSLKLFPGLLQEEGEDRWVRGYGAEAGFRYFPWGEAPAGGWVQLRGVLASMEGVNIAAAGENEPRELGGYVSVLAGYTAIFEGGFLLSGGLGVQYVDYAIGDVGTRSVLPAAHTTVGYAF